MKQYRFRPATYIVYFDKVLVNFTNNLEISSYNNLQFIDYTIKDSDTVEQIAFKGYGDSSLSWVILWINNIIDPFYDWPLSTNELYTFIYNKYGDSENNIHHYEKDDKVVNGNVFGAIGITNKEYEENKNNKKRKIKLPTQDTMGIIINAIQ